jgi:DNA-binding response OmpR family regulator
MKKTSSPPNSGASSRAKSTKLIPQESPPTLPSPALVISRRRILLADDDSGVRESLAAALRSDGYVVLPARDGQEALELIAVSEVDLVLLDLNMPVKNGWDTFERLTAEHPLTPIIIITARPNQLFTALGAGAGALLEKPLDIAELLRTIHRLLREPGEAPLRRLAGRDAPFYYQPAHAECEGAQGPTRGVTKPSTPRLNWEVG